MRLSELISNRALISTGTPTRGSAFSTESGSACNFSSIQFQSTLKPLEYTSESPLPCLTGGPPPKSHNPCASVSRLKYNLSQPTWAGHSGTPSVHLAWLTSWPGLIQWSGLPTVLKEGQETCLRTHAQLLSRAMATAMTPPGWAGLCLITLRKSTNTFHLRAMFSSTLHQHNSPSVTLKQTLSASLVADLILQMRTASQTLTSELDEA